MPKKKKVKVDEVVLDNDVDVFESIKAPEMEAQELEAEQPEPKPDPVDKVLDKVRAKETEKQIMKSVDGDPREKRKLIIKINRYRMSFTKDLNNTIPHSLESYSLYELEDLLDEVRLVVSNRQSSNFMKSLYFNGAGLVENLAPRFLKLNLTGLRTNLEQNQTVDETLDELSIEYSALDYVPPEQRLALATFMTLNETFIMNRLVKTQSKTIEKNLNNPVNQDVLNQYNDI